MTVKQLQRKIAKMEKRLQELNNIIPGIIGTESFGSICADVYSAEIKALVKNYLLNVKERKGEQVGAANS